MKRVWVAAGTAIILSVALISCGQQNQDGSKGAAPGKGAGGPPAGLPAPEVEVIVATPGQATITQELPGRLQAVRTSQVRARVEGIIERRLFKEGSDVKEGTPLFRIDPRNYQAAFESARADQLAAKLLVDRYRPLLEVKAVSQQEFDLAEARLKQADAALMRSKIDLENTTVPAPISGRVGRELVTEGALVGRGEATPLTVIEQIDPIFANFTQSGADLQRLRQAIKRGRLKEADRAKVQLILEDGSVYARPGRLIFSDLAVDPATGSVSMRAEFPNPQRELLPGAFVRIRFPEAVAEDVILLPQRAVQAGPMGQFVTVVDAQGKAVAIPVKTAGMSGPNFVIAEGLKGGEQVVVNGLQRARPGTTVRPVVLGPDGKPLPKPEPPAEQAPAPDSSSKPTAGSEKAAPIGKEMPVVPSADKASAPAPSPEKK